MILISQDEMTMIPFDGSTVEIRVLGAEIVEIYANDLSMGVYKTEEEARKVFRNMIDEALKGAKEFMFPDEVTE
jgi:hypothetical protein